MIGDNLPDTSSEQKSRFRTTCIHCAAAGIQDALNQHTAPEHTDFKTKETENSRNRNTFLNLPSSSFLKVKKTYEGFSGLPLKQVLRPPASEQHLLGTWKR